MLLRVIEIITLHHSVLKERPINRAQTIFILLYRVAEWGVNFLGVECFHYEFAVIEKKRAIEISKHTISA